MQQDQRQARARLASAAARLSRQDDPERRAEVERLRRDYRFIAAQKYLQRLIDNAPPLTATQRDRLAILLQSDAE